MPHGFDGPPSPADWVDRASKMRIGLTRVFQPAPAPHYSHTVLDRPEPPRREGQDGAAILERLGYGADEAQRILA